MNAVEIEEAISALAEQAIDPGEFPFGLPVSATQSPGSEGRVDDLGCSAEHRSWIFDEELRSFQSA